MELFRCDLQMHLLFLLDLLCLTQVDLDVVRNQWVESGEVFDQIYQAADLYGIFEDLFQYAHFWPCLMLEVVHHFAADVL